MNKYIDKYLNRINVKTNRSLRAISRFSSAKRLLRLKRRFKR